MTLNRKLGESKGLGDDAGRAADASAPSYRNSIRIIVITIVAVIVGAAVYSEAVLRVIDPGAFFRTWFSAGATRSDPRFGYVMAPGFRGHQEYQEVRLPIALDGMGFRNTQIDSSATAHRILFVGGASLTFGWGVKEAETFPSVAAAALEPKGWQAINVSTPGFMLLRQLAHWSAMADSLRPEILVVVMQPIIDAGNYVRADSGGGALRLAPKRPLSVEFVHGQPMPPTISSPFLETLYRSCYLGARIVYPRAEREWDARLDEEHVRGMTEFGYQNSVDFLLDVVTEYCATRGVDLYIVTPRGRVPAEFRDALQSYRDRKGYRLPYLDLRDLVFQTPSPLVHGHFTAEANREIGLTIAGFINERRRRGTTWGPR